MLISKFLYFRTYIYLKVLKQPYNYMEQQYSKHRLYYHFKNPAKLSKENSSLPFVSFLNEKDIQLSSTIHQKRCTPFLPSKPRRLQKKLYAQKQSKEHAYGDTLKVVNANNLSQLTKLQNGREKQHGQLQKNSSLVTEQKYSKKFQNQVKNRSYKQMKYITKILKSCIYFNYYVINSSGTYKQQRHNIFSKKKWNTTKQDLRTYTQSYSNTSPTKVQMKHADFKDIRKQPKLKRMLTVPVQLGPTLKMTTIE